MGSEYDSECLFQASLYGVTGPMVFAPLVRWVFVPSIDGTSFHNGWFGYWQKEVING